MRVWYGFYVKAVDTSAAIFRNIAPCSLRMYYLHLLSRKSAEPETGVQLLTGPNPRQR
jgi:hypothetical protein